LFCGVDHWLSPSKGAELLRMEAVCAPLHHWKMLSAPSCQHVWLTAAAAAAAAAAPAAAVGGLQLTEACARMGPVDQINYSHAARVVCKSLAQYQEAAEHLAIRLRFLS
jgi:hypothetical protein